MRKFLFYFFILKKAFLLLIYPIFEQKGEIFKTIRKNIENYLIFQPSKLRAVRIQRKLLKKINPIRFINSDRIKLYAWFLKPVQNMPVFLHFHGQAESILSHQDVALFCAKEGFGLFMLSYRGHYKSWGKASEQGIYDDAQAAICELKKLGVDADKIILWGHSLGSAVAIETALHNKVAGIILQSPIKEIKSAAIDVYNFYCKRIHLDLMGVFVKAHVMRINFVQQFDNMNKIQKVKCPILILHSTTDKIAPCQNSVELSNQNENAELFLSEKGSHWGANWCFDKIFEFIQSLGYDKKIKGEKILSEKAK